MFYLKPQAEAGGLETGLDRRGGAELRQTMTSDRSKTKTRLIEELAVLRRKIVDLEAERDKAEQYCDIIEGADDVIFRLDKEGRFEFVNRVAARILGGEVEELIGRRFIDFIHPEDKEAAEAAFTAWLVDKVPSVTQEARVVNSATGEVYRMLWTFTLSYDEEGELSGINSIGRDITIRTLAEEELVRANVLLESLINSIPDLIFYKDRDGGYMGCNAAFMEFVGRDEAEIFGRFDQDILPVEVAEEFHRRDRRVLATGQPSREETWVDYPDGRRVLLDLLKTPYHDPNGALLGLIGIGRDITERKLAEEERERLIAQLEKAYEHLRSLSIRDELTGVANRRHFNQVLQTEWRRAKRLGHPLGLIMIDIDFFKNFNDSYGHLAGDDCLRMVAGALETALKRGGDFLARYGGEEFAAILPNTDLDGVASVAEHMRRAVEALELPHKDSSVSDRVTVSLGAASVVPNGFNRSDDLIDAADKALYEAKAAGRNRLAKAKSSAAA